MKRFLLSKAGLVSVCIVTVIMAFMLHRVTTRARTREAEQKDQPRLMAGRNGREKLQPPDEKTQGLRAGELNKETSEEAAKSQETESPKKAETRKISGGTGALQENLSYLDQSRSLSSQSKKDRDRQGRSQIRRKTAGSVSEAQNTEQETVVVKKKTSLHLRLEGRGAGGKAVKASSGNQDMSEEAQGAGDTILKDQWTSLNGQEDAGGTLQQGARGPGSETLDTIGPGVNGPRGTAANQAGADSRMAGAGADALLTSEAQEGFCPYGRPIRCELVFTIDSCMEETPLVALVMEPVYNNGQLVIPAGAELHGMARPDRLRDRIFSASEWVLLFPREGGLANGRELRVKGLALDRAEPAADGLSWGITDGSNGLQGQIIRTLENEEIKRFAATFISASALGLQEREGSGRDGSRYKNSPTNAALQGVAATLEDAARKIGAEIERHGVFLRVPGGKQFYFYPQQAIHPRMAMLPKPAVRPAGRD